VTVATVVEVKYFSRYVFQPKYSPYFSINFELENPKRQDQYLQKPEMVKAHSYNTCRLYSIAAQPFYDRVV
jgi:hypothetical protein